MERFDIWVTPYTGILTLAKLKYFMSKDLITKTLQSCTAANNTRRYSEYETRNTECKSGSSYAHKKLWLKVELLITLWNWDQASFAELSEHFGIHLVAA